jgi:hypothetical protein
MQPIWKQRPGEPDVWYARFELYRLLGPRRSLVRAYRLSMRLEEQPVRKPGPLWYAMAKEWDWRLRASAWDVAVEAQRALQNQQRESRRDPYADRRAKLDELIAGVLKAMDEADLKNLERDEARRILPTLRGLLRDLMAAQRSEAGLRQAAGQESPDALSEDMLRQVDLELERWQSDRSLAPLSLADQRLPGPAPPATPEGNRTALRDVLASLYPDEASARRVAAQAGLEVGRISFSPLAVNNWHAILAEAERSDRLQALIQVVRAEYGANRALQRVLQGYRRK